MDIGIVRPVNVEEEMKSSYLDYAMSVIVSRALPDARDGLKPSQRRILVAMHDLNLAPNRPHRKCAKIAGDTSGNYHPHGEAVIYPTLVRMAQTFNMRYPLIDGQGNFGSIDGDPPAAMRYTEARMTAVAVEMMADIEKQTVEFTPNYDGTRQEPVVLPSRFPNLICNGSAGIAVGMATNIPPHNLNEVVDALIYIIDNPEAPVEELYNFVKGPDFPTGALILGTEGIKTAYATGRGRIVLRAKTRIEEGRSNRFQIIVTELPFQINKANLIEKIAELVKDKKIEGISDLRDESDRQGMRIVIEVKRDAKPQAVLNRLYKHTAMQSAFGMNMLALVDGQPRVLTLKRLLAHFLEHRQEVLTRRTRFELAKAKDRAHILEGLKIALDNLDEVIQTIRSSRTPEPDLIARFGITEIQAKAILDMQLRRLAVLERQKILDEYAEVLRTIAYLEDLLANPIKILHLVRDELLELKQKYGDERRTRIVAAEVGNFSDEDLIEHQEVLITLSSRGYTKRLPCDTYQPQRRGGKGIKGMVFREEDTLRHMLVADTHDNLLFFTDKGKVYRLTAHEVPESARQAKGLPLVNLISLDPNEAVSTVVAVPNFEAGDYFLMATRKGEIKKTPLRDFSSVRSNGLIAMSLEDGDELVHVRYCRAGSEVVLVSEQGQAIRFTEKQLRAASRTSGGVRGMRLDDGDRVIAMDIVVPDSDLLLVTANGFGKRTPLQEFSAHGRGGGGVRALMVTDKTGPVAAARVVKEAEELLIISAGGLVIRTPVNLISCLGRSAQGVNVMNLRENDRVASISFANGNGSSAKGTAEAPSPAGVVEEAALSADDDQEEEAAASPADNADDGEEDPASV
ncbi:MAG: DNA gyrase subunit A [Chloroflexi bacterium]|nr:DNA gyrase subunit A [Chloroflexota bacterium]